MRKIDVAAFKAPQPVPDPGLPPTLLWISVERLVVDETYQRPIVGAGRTNVARIAAGFDWSKFAPLIVAPTDGGQYAVIDGQHRATAAALIGVERVPAMVVIADRRAQAAAFKAVNGVVTQVSPLTLHRAAVAAGDQRAIEIDQLVAAGKASIAPYPRAPEHMRLGETLALGAVRSSLRLYGRDVAITALQCVTETTNNIKGGLGATTILALGAVLAENACWRDAGTALFDAFDEIDLAEELEEAKATRRQKHTSLWEVLQSRLARRLDALLPRPKAA